MLFIDLARARWRFRDTSSRTWMPARIPGCVHLDLRRAGRIPDPFSGTNELDLQWIEERGWEYAADFAVPAALLREERVELVADGLDTVATVWLNGRRIARTDNMFVGHRLDVKGVLRAGKNELRIVFGSALEYIRETRADFTPPVEFNDPVGNCVRIRKQQCQFGWDWGPRFVTAGVWRGLRVEAGPSARLAHVGIAQRHEKAGRKVTLIVHPELSGPAPAGGARHTLVCFLAGREVARVADAVGEVFELAIPKPELWWPAGQGAQPLYDVEVSSRDAEGRVLGVVTKRVGLRTIVLDQSPDEAGRRFRFVINGRPVFIKGANWIPAHAFVAGLTRENYARDLRAAAAAHMNCVRVWGGGVYESEDFYDLCDELGLMAWQDFMFACTLYPSDDAFLASVRTEAEFQLRRLGHRACIGIWCGNNEVAGLNAARLREDADARAGYERLFHDLLAKAVARHVPDTAYVPSSDWRGTFETGHEIGVRQGDTHYWDVWHARQPVKDYEKWRFRFCSEFGMQSYSSPATNRTFAPADANIFGAVMENHQKNRGGNQVILDYVSRRYRFPKSQDDLIYLSQLNQAYCMQVGVEHYRRTMPHCMGAIYWQLNDCWPVASWSSIEFTGRWKALHHAARRFNAPALVSAHVPGDEGTIIGNYRRSTVREVALHTIYDAPEPARGTLRWDLFTLDGDVVLSGRQAVALRPGQSVRRRTLDLAGPLASHGRDRLYLRVALDVEDRVASEQTVFLAPPRFLDLPRGKTKVSLRMPKPTEALFTFRSDVFQHAFAFDLGDLAFTAEDNFFDLHPGEPKTVKVVLGKPAGRAALLAALTWRSLADTYA